METCELNTKFEISRKEERFMSMINLFLQKRKMHENHHGIIMVVTAYVLSVIMLVMGSDVFYSINSTAAGINVDTDEEAQELLSEELPDLHIADLQNADLQNANYATPIVLSKLVNPYGLTNTSETGTGLPESQSVTLDGDTVWLLGSAMNYEEYDSAMEQMNEFNSDASLDQTTSTLTKETEDTIESLSTQEAVSSSFITASEDEVIMLERIVEAEASGEDMIGKILIANVIFNRMADEEFPDTIKGVIFQKVSGDYQFSPISDERYWSVKITKGTKKAVERALEGEDYSEGALYFIARKRTKTSSAKWFDQHLDWLFKHGGHEFYKNK